MSMNLWAGDDSSQHQGIIALAKVHEHLAANPGDRSKMEFAAYTEDDEDENLHPILQVVDGVAIVTVQGALYDATFGYLGKWYGICGYGDIQIAMTQAVKNYDVKTILLVIKSGGGQVSGMEETAKFIRSVGAVKPVVAFSPSAVASAALYLALAAQRLTIGSTAIAGSIGTLNVLTSMHKMYQEMGIDHKVVRSGEFKALGHPLEPLSETALKEAQEKVDYLALLFEQWVAERRGTTAAAVRTRYGQGRTFVGQQAVDVGLVDAVSDYSTSFMDTKKLSPTDNNPRFVGAKADIAQNLGHNAQHLEGNPMAHIPSPEELAALAALPGTDTPAASTPETPEVPETPEASADPKVTELEAQVAQLTEQHEAQAGELTAAQAKIAELEAQVAADASTTEALATIVRGTMKSMFVALNKKADEVDSTGTAELAAKFDETSVLFRSKFKAGGVAQPTPKETEAPKPEASETASTSEINAVFLAAAALRKTK